MILREKSANKLTTQHKNQEKWMLMLLEDCKQIPKNDRLELREQIKRDNPQILFLLKAFRKQPRNMQNLQIALRRFVTRIKQQRSEAMMKRLRNTHLRYDVQIVAVATTPTKRSKSKFKKIEVEKKRPKWFQEIMSRSRQSLGRRSSYSKTPLTGPSADHSPVRKMTHQSSQDKLELEKYQLNNSVFSFNNNQQNLAGSPKTIIYEQLTKSELEETIKSQKAKLPPNQPIYIDEVDTNDLFTNPKMLAECRQYVSKFKHNKEQPIQKQTSVPKLAVIDLPAEKRKIEEDAHSPEQSINDKMQFFKNKNVEEVVPWFFEDAFFIVKEDFSRRLYTFMELHLAPMEDFVEIDTFFWSLFNKDQRLYVSHFGAVMEKLCYVSPASEIRLIFETLSGDNSKVSRDLFNDSKWKAVFDRANCNEEQEIDFWQFFTVRKTWEYVAFSIWYQELSRPGSHAQ